MARNAGVKVILDGSGGDEAFHGYHHLLYPAVYFSLVRSWRAREAIQELRWRRRTDGRLDAPLGVRGAEARPAPSSASVPKATLDSPGAPGRASAAPGANAGRSSPLRAHRVTSALAQSSRRPRLDELLARDAQSVPRLPDRRARPGPRLARSPAAGVVEVGVAGGHARRAAAVDRRASRQAGFQDRRSRLATPRRSRLGARGGPAIGVLRRPTVLPTGRIAGRCWPSTVRVGSSSSTSGARSPSNVGSGCSSIRSVFRPPVSSSPDVRAADQVTRLDVERRAASPAR